MESFMNWISIVGGIVGGLTSYFLGGWDALLKTLVILTILDFITGWIKSIINRRLSSEVGFYGVLRKCVVYIVVAMAYAIQNLLGANIPLREIVISFYICNEGLSLLENAAEIIPIPEKLKQVLLQLRAKGE